MHDLADANVRTIIDEPLSLIGNYVSHAPIKSELAYDTARYCLMDAIGCSILALKYPACVKLLGPVIPGTVYPIGSKIPGTAWMLDPIQAAFNIGTMIRWLDFNDTWLAAEWGHPSDNLGAILAVADYMSRKKKQENEEPLIMKDVLTAMIKAYEIQGVLALENSFNQLGFDHVILVRVASTALATYLLGGNEADVCAALSQAWLDGTSLRAYRHAPNTGSRKSWAAGDATSRAVKLAWLTLKGEPGYQTPLSTTTWGFYDTYLNGNSLKFSRPFDCYVMENILFKISYPAEFHAQTAVESAIKLHQQFGHRLNEIKKIHIKTQKSAIRIISKTGPLYNPADRDHCLQYMTAIALIHGDLTADHYEDQYADDPRVDALRAKMHVLEEAKYSKDYLDPAKRSIANGIQIDFNDGSHTEWVEVEYPIGHKLRRQEGLPLLIQKFKKNMGTCFTEKFVDEFTNLFLDQDALASMPVDKFMDCMSNAEVIKKKIA